MGDFVVSLVIATVLFGFVFATFLISLALTIFYVEHKDKERTKPAGPHHHHHFFGGHLFGHK